MFLCFLSFSKMKIIDTRRLSASVRSLIPSAHLFPTLNQQYQTYGTGKPIVKSLKASLVKWHPLPLRSSKLNIDVAVLGDLVGMSAIVRDFVGNTLL